MLFDEGDSDREEQKVSIVDGINPTLQEASVNQDGVISDKADQKLFDKQMRAFSISVDSSKRFELAIRKPRNKLKHKYNSLKKFIYQLLLLFQKHHGSPAEDTDFTWYFVAYAVVLALDIFLFVIMCMRCF